MSNRYVEKTFLYLLLVSLLVHLTLGTLVYLMPPEKTKAVEETTMVELKDLPEPPPPPAEKPKPKPPKPEPKPEPVPKPLPRPVAIPVPLSPETFLPQARKELAPKAENEEERVVQEKSASDIPEKSEPSSQPVKSPGSADSAFRTPEKGGMETPRGEGFLKPRRGEKVELAKLFPSARKMETLEETYRKKYRDVEQGDTRMIDTDDPLVSVYSHRLLVAANQSFRFNARESVHEPGVGVLEVTIQRDGNIEGVRIIESTNNRALDDLVARSIRRSSYVGPLPKKWTHDRLKLIWVYYSRGTGTIH